MKKVLRFSALATIITIVMIGFSSCGGDGDDPTVPDPPTDFTAVAGNGTVTLSWTASASDGGSAILRYEVSKDESVTWETASTTTGHTFVGLTNRTEYTFKVRAVNAAGHSNTATVLATPLNPDENPLGGVAPYNEAKDYLLEQMFKELSVELVTKRNRGDVWLSTEHRIFDAKGGSFHLYTYNLYPDFPGERRGQRKLMYHKAGNQYAEYEWNWTKNEWDGPAYFSEELIEQLIYYIAAFWLPFQALANAYTPQVKFTAGSKTVMGKECEKYLLSIITDDKYYYWVDKANGLLMEALVPVGEPDIEEIECTKFVTSGVTLPSIP